MEIFLTILHDFGKQWLNSFAWKAMVVKAVQKKFIPCKNIGMELFTMRKNVRIKILFDIWWVKW